MKPWILIFILAFCSSIWGSPQDDFFRASLNGELEKVENLVKNEGIQLIHKCDKDHNTSLHLACCAKKGGYKKELIQYLIDKGADVNAKNRYSTTPLHIAVSTLNFEGTEVLLKAKNIVPNLREDHTETVLHYAVQMKSIPMLTLLLSHEHIDPNVGTSSGATPLHFAAMIGLIEEAKILIEDPRTDIESMQVNSDYIGATPLHFAAMQAQVEIVRMLLEKKANVHVTISKGIYAGFTPLHFAVMNSDTIQAFETIKLLFLAGANMKCKAASGQRPYDLTSVNVIQKFLEHPDKNYILKQKN